MLDDNNHNSSDGSSRIYKTYSDWRRSDECKEWEKQRKLNYAKWLEDNGGSGSRTDGANINNTNPVQVRLRSKYHVINKDSEGYEFIPEQRPENDLDLIPRFVGSTLSAENRRQFDQAGEEHMKFKRLRGE
jgi:hypothetical protein